MKFHFEGDPFEYLLAEHDLTLKTLARKYYWIAFSKEDLLQDLILNVAISLVGYDGKLTNMNSVVTLLAKRHINDRIQQKYAREGFCKCVDFPEKVDGVDAYCVSVGPWNVSRVSMENEVLLKLDSEKLDAEVLSFIMKASDYTLKRIHSGDLNIRGSHFFSIAKEALSDWEWGNLHDSV